ncbi:aminotransferase-like domain-containing protein [Candidatus Contubernalis alkaliaceticus]|uniref:hypothetical protein n=1 Tax=Candidatus Contubernalis alkaliaceticus TaxID=338645 RepID=UPI001F4C13E6|nr:hypothetical protein [Candidatus Contubernalis alkalaceticus]UNC91069.1 hypothetical protein HUE98_02595 [Candidatus Contubernalis alkalaceticus]
MRKIYGQRRLLLDTLHETFECRWCSYGDAAGLHLTIEFPGMRFDSSFRKKCLKNGINITPVEYHCIQKGRHVDKLLIGYGHLEPKEIQSGIKLLHELITQQ